MKTWTEAEIARIAELAKDYPAREIAERMGFTKNQIIGVVRRNGIKLSNRRLSRSAGGWYDLSEERRLAIVKDAKARGLTASQLAGELRIPSSTLGTFTKTRKIELLRHNRRPPPSRLQYGPAFTTPSPNPVTVVDRRRDQCAWPLDLPEGTMMCGELALEGKSYCAGHYRRAYGG